MRSDYRADVRGEGPQPNLMAGLNDIADTDTGLVATPEARPRADRTQPRVRHVAEPKPADVAEPKLAELVEQPVVAAAAPSVEAAEPAPKKIRAPRKPKADAAGGDAGGDGQAAAE